MCVCVCVCGVCLKSVPRIKTEKNKTQYIHKVINIVNTSNEHFKNAPVAVVEEERPPRIKPIK